MFATVGLPAPPTEPDSCLMSCIFYLMANSANLDSHFIILHFNQQPNHVIPIQRAAAEQRTYAGMRRVDLQLAAVVHSIKRRRYEKKCCQDNVGTPLVGSRRDI